MGEHKELDVVSDLYSMTVRGRNYTITVMPLAYAKEYMDEDRPLIIGDGEGGFNKVLFNFLTIRASDGESVNMVEKLEKWIPRLLKYEGRPATLELLMAHEWDIVDLGRFLKKAVGLSG